MQPRRLHRMISAFVAERLNGNQLCHCRKCNTPLAGRTNHGGTRLAACILEARHWKTLSHPVQVSCCVLCVSTAALTALCGRTSARTVLCVCHMYLFQCTIGTGRRQKSTFPFFVLRGDAPEGRVSARQAQTKRMLWTARPLKR